MIIDFDWNPRQHIFSISYVNSKGTKSFYEYNINRFKEYFASPTGKYTNWDGTKCELKYTDKPNKFSFKEFIEDLPETTKKNLFNVDNVPKFYAWDIETKFNPDEKPDPQTAKFPVTAISIVNPDMTVMVMSYKDLTEDENLKIKGRIQKYLEDIEFFNELDIQSNFIYKKFDCEHDMLQWFLKNIVAKVPVLGGWNSDGFDWQYVVNRCKNYYDDIDISSSSCKERLDVKRVVNTFRPTESIRVSIPKHTHIVDLMDVIKEHDMAVLPMKESMSLDWVSNQVLGVGKIEYEGNLNTLFEDDFEQFIFYNAIDSVLVQLLYKKFGTMNIIYNYANVTHLPIKDCYGKIAPTEALFFQNFYNKGLKVVYYPDKQVERGTLIGAYVKEPIAGLYDYPCCFDFSGLYPTTIACFNISVENFVGAFYDNEKLKPYISDSKYIVVGGSVFKNKNYGTKKAPERGDLIGTFLDEEKLRPYREDLNYLVSINGHVYKNDKDYAFKEIQIDLKNNRNKTKYLAKNVDAQVMSVIDRILNGEENSDWDDFTEDVKDWMLNKYNISNKHDIVNYQDLKILKTLVSEDITNMYAREQSFKLLGNSAYGGSSHPYFYWFNMALANDITGEGRNLIHMMEQKTEEFFNNFPDMQDIHKKLGITVDEESFRGNVSECVTVYQDTDSSYINMGIIVKSINELKGKNDTEVCKFLERFANKIINPYFDDILTKYITSRHGKNYHKFELETIGKRGCWIGIKKRYAQAILWKDGRLYDHPKIKVKGLEIAKASYPSLSRKALGNLVDMILLSSEDKTKFIHTINKKMMEWKQKFLAAGPDEVSMAISVSDYWKYINSDDNPIGLDTLKGAPFNVKALGYYNWLLNTKKLEGDNIYGGKVKCYVTKKTDPKNQDNYFAYQAGNWPSWANKYAQIDYNAMFIKTVLEPLNRILTKIGYNALNLDGSINVQLDLFGGMF